MEMMSRTMPGPEILNLAQRLVAYEATGDSTLAIDRPAEFRIVEKLRRPLSRLAGVNGFRMLLVRALTLAKAQVSGLSLVHVKPDGSLEGFSDSGDQAAEAGVKLVAELLGLLTTFVGEAFTFTLILDVWPDFPVFDTEPWRKSDHDPAR